MSDLGEDSVGADESSAEFPISEILGGVCIQALPPGTAPQGLIAFIKLLEPDGDIGWSFRITPEISHEEQLGILTGYVEHLKREAADWWKDETTD